MLLVFISKRVGCTLVFYPAASSYFCLTVTLQVMQPCALALRVWQLWCWSLLQNYIPHSYICLFLKSAIVLSGCKLIIKLAGWIMLLLLHPWQKYSVLFFFSDPKLFKHCRCHWYYHYPPLIFKTVENFLKLYSKELFFCYIKTPLY